MITLRIPEMSCGHCVKAIDGAVKGVDPSASVDADLARHIVKVTSTASEAALRLAIKDVGYDNEKLIA
jgi:copper chaperone